MAKIRTVKPDYWVDAKISRLPDSTALFFIALWNFADDYGYFPSDTLELSKRVARWRPQAVQPMLSRLEKDGLVRVSRRAGVGLIVGWSHQRIRDRHISKWNNTEIEWDEVKDDAPPPAENGLGKERKGKERKGKERMLGVQAPPGFNLELPNLGAEAQETEESCEQSPSDKLTAVPVYLSIGPILTERRVSEEVQLRWEQAFPDSEWVCQSVRKALAWESAHPNRRKKNFAAFMTNWLNRDWDRRRTPMPHNRAENRSMANYEVAEAVKKRFREQEVESET